MPVFVTQVTGRGEHGRAHRIYRVLPNAEKVEFIPATAGTHGSSTLRADTNPAGAEENWQAMLKFLSQFKKP